MPEIEEFRTKIEAIQERLDGSNGADSDEIRELKERLGTVRDSLQRKQDTIVSQKAEIAGLREENEQLSDMLGQAVAALEAQSQGGIREIVQSIDTEFAGLLSDGEAQEEPGTDGDGDRQGAASGEAQTQGTQSQGNKSQETQSQDPEWQPDNESPRALQRIMGRRKR